MSESFIHCKYVISGYRCDTLIRDAAILIEDTKIVAIGKEKDVKTLLSGHDKYERLNHIAIPSLINAHTHLPETLLRGICDSSKLQEWLFDYIWPFESRLTAKDAYYGALLGALELIESGVAGFIDQYFYVESIEKAVKEAKIRSLLCPSLFDNTPESGSLESTWKHISKFLQSRNTKKNQNSESCLIRFGIGPHAPYTVPEEYLLKVSDLAEKYCLPIHIHLNETKKEVYDFISKFGVSPFEYLEQLGLLKYKTLGAHCVHTSEHDREIMKKYNVTVLHNPQSNLKLASGVAPVHNYLKRGIEVAIGTDGNASNNNLDMLEELRTAALLQKYKADDPTVITNAQALFMGSISGSRALGVENPGLLRGSPADITILSLDASHAWPQNDPLSNVVYSSSSQDTNDLIVNGRFVYKNKEHQTLDKIRIVETSAKIAERILTDMGK
ncbi:MAG: amidohydrolase [Candidatus Heimdallarchaeaceae archaeon]